MLSKYAFLLVVFAWVCTETGFAAPEPYLEWEFAAESNLYAPPLVADIQDSPGKEIILSDSDVRLLRCIDATGRQIWQYDGDWKKRQTSSAALTARAGTGGPLLIVGNSDGTLHCVDAQKGTLVWKQEVGTIQWGNAIWADVDGDGRDEALAGTEDQGVFCFRADGSRLWANRGEDGGQRFQIRCPIAASDIDGDGKAEIFFASKRGVVCLSGDGSIQWETYTGDDFSSSVVVADADADGKAEVFSCSMKNSALFCFDARSGSVRWRSPLFAETDVYPGSAIAVGDIDHDGLAEIVAADKGGSVYCFACDGSLLWVFPTPKKTFAGATLGDVDGDGEVEVLVASGDRHLYCLDHEGNLEWSWKNDLRLISPPTIADIDNDGMTEILFGGSDKTLKVLTLDGRHVESLLPWPSRRFDPEQSGASFGKTVRHQAPLVQYEKELFEAGGFEEGRILADAEDYPPSGGLYERLKSEPVGWYALATEGTAWTLDNEVKRTGSSSVRISGKGESFEFASDLLEVPPFLRSVRARILSTAKEGKALLRWIGKTGVLREVPLVLAPESVSDGTEQWFQFDLEESPRPRGSLRVQIVCTSHLADGGEDIWWDDCELVGLFQEPRMVRAMSNQVGYEMGAPKRFTAQSNFLPENASFALIDDTGSVVFASALESKGRIKGSYGHDWGYNYWRGDFSEFDQPGEFRIRIDLDGETDLSYPFEVGKGVLWEETSRPAYRFFYYQRCGMAIPGFHGACHLDDAVNEDGSKQFDLAGGWHDAGDYNKYHNAPYVLGLVTAYGHQKEAFDLQDFDGNGMSDFFDEILWGGDFSRRMMAPDGSVRGAITSGYGFWGAPELETDNIMGSGDERPMRGAESGGNSTTHTAAMAKIARYLGEEDGLFTEAAERGLKWALAQGWKDIPQLNAAIDLYVATGKEEYAELAREILPSVGARDPEALRAYDSVFGEDHSEDIRKALVAEAERVLELADNPFGVHTFGPKENPNFFGRPRRGDEWYVGTSSQILESAKRVAMAYQYAPEPRYLQFVLDQFNWILGNNPYDISLMEGVGDAFPPSYHHRYTFGGVERGAVPGSVVNGITLRSAGDDRPHFDMQGLDIPNFQSNEVWLPHNTHYLNALANLRTALEEMR